MLPWRGHRLTIVQGTAAFAVARALAACAASLPYRPERQPFGATIADVHASEDRLRVEIDSEGYRVERAVLVRDGGAEITPEAVVPPMATLTGGLSIGLGVGAGDWGSRGSYSVGTGVGVGLGGPRPATTMEISLDPARLRAQ